MVGRGSHSVLMVPDGPPGYWGPRGGRTSAAARQARIGWNLVGPYGKSCHSGHGVAKGCHPAVTPWLASRISGDQRAGSGLRPGISRRSPPRFRPRGLPTHDSASGRVFCAPPDGPLRRPPQGLPGAHHRLQLPVRLPEHLVARQFSVFLRSPAPHARQQHHPTANVRSQRLAPFLWRPQSLRLRHAVGIQMILTENGHFSQIALTPKRLEINSFRERSLLRQACKSRTYRCFQAAASLFLFRQERVKARIPAQLLPEESENTRPE